VNRSLYRLVWNHSLGALQVVSELARGKPCGSAHGSRQAGRRAGVAAWPLALLALGVAASADATSFYEVTTGAASGSGSFSDAVEVQQDLVPSTIHIGSSVSSVDLSATGPVTTATSILTDAPVTFTGTLVGADRASTTTDGLREVAGGSLALTDVTLATSGSFTGTEGFGIASGQAMQATGSTVYSEATLLGGRGSEGEAGLWGGYANNTPLQPAGTGSTGFSGGAGFYSTQSVLRNAGTIKGGLGGQGGTGGKYAYGSGTTLPAQTTGGAGGLGGTGGAGIAGSGLQIYNTGTISGGDGGVGGNQGLGSAGGMGTGGAGGVGILGAGNTLVYNAGTIAGGFADDGNGAQANAIEFSNGGNRLVLEQGSVIEGNVVSLDGGDSFALGGDTSAAGGNRFDLAGLGTQYQGFDTLTKQGQSTWLLQGADALGQAWVVNAGTLALDQGASLAGGVEVNAGALALDQGASIGGTVAIASGATLMASTASIGTLLNQGTVGFGASRAAVDTLTTQAFTQASTGTLTLRALSSNAFDKLVVNGTARLDGTLAVDVTGGNTLATGDLLNPVVRATSVIGQFAQVSDNSLLFNFKPTYTATTVGLDVVSAAVAPAEPAPSSVPAVPVTPAVPATPTVPAAPAAPTAVSSLQASNNHFGLGAAKALDSTFASNPGGRLARYFIPLTTRAEVSRAVNETLPAPNASAAAASTALTSVNQVIQARSEAIRGMASGEGFTTDGHLWLRPFGSWARQDGTGGAANMTAAVGGLAIGADGHRTEFLTLGTAFVYANVNSHNTGDSPRQSLDTDVFQLVGYGNYQLDATTVLHFQLDAGQNRNDGKRAISFGGVQATSNYASWTAHAGTSVDRTYTVAPSTRVTPSMRADYTWIKDDAYTEKGADALDLKANKRTTDALILGVDGKLAHDLTSNMTVSLNAGVGYDFLADRNAITAAYAGAPGAAFTTYGNAAQHWVGRGGAGLSYKVNERVQVAMRYDAEARKNFNNQTASAEVRWAF
jgi:outer membrane autotransporter protein